MLGSKLTPDAKEVAQDNMQNPDLPFEEREKAFNALASDAAARFVEFSGKKSDDAMQQALLQAFEYFLGKGAGLETAKFETWIKSVADKRFIDNLRKFAREKSFGGSQGEPGEASIGDVSDAYASQGDSVLTRPPVAHIPDPQQALMRKEREGAFGDLMTAIEAGDAGLSNAEKIVIKNQLALNPKSTSEIALELETSEGQVGTLSSRARQKISAWLNSSRIDAERKEKIKELLSGIVSGGESLQETIKATILEMLKEGTIDFDDLGEPETSEEEKEKKKLERKGYLPKPNPLDELPTEYDEPLGATIGDVALEEANESMMESEDDVVHGEKPTSVSRYSPKSPKILYCTDMVAPPGVEPTVDYDTITCKDCQAKIVNGVNDFLKYEELEDVLDGRVSLPDDLVGLDLNEPPSWLMGKFS